MAFFYFWLFLFWTLFGSFASVVIHRLHSWEKGIMKGRSHCPKCHKTLWFFDLFPVLSYLFSLGKCRYCKKKIPFIYPILELSMGILFCLSTFFLVDIESLLSWNIHSIVKFVFLLLLAFCTVVYVFYDILYLEIPESILAIANIATLGFLFYASFFFYSFENNMLIITLSFTTLALFWALYYIMTQEQSEKKDIIILWISWIVIFLLWQSFWQTIFSFAPFSGITAAYILFSFFYLQYYFSSGTWIGGGDFRIALLMGLILWLPFLLVGFLSTYLIGSIIGIIFIIFLRIKKWKWKQKMMIPFGPFLAFGIYFTLFFGQKAIDTFYLYL